MVEAAACRLGVALSPKILSCDDISHERLIAPNGFGPDGTEYGTILPSGIHEERSEQMSVLIDWLVQQFRLLNE